MTKVDYRRPRPKRNRYTGFPRTLKELDRWLERKNLAEESQIPALPLNLWTDVVLGSDFSTTSTTPVSVTGLSFTPGTNARYHIRVLLLLRTADIAAGPQPGFSWPSVIEDGGGLVLATQAVNEARQRLWGTLDTQVAGVTALPNTSASHLTFGQAVVTSADTVTGNVQVVLASSDGTSVTAKKGSFLSWRKVI